MYNDRRAWDTLNTKLELPTEAMPIRYRISRDNYKTCWIITHRWVGCICAIGRPAPFVQCLHVPLKALDSSFPRDRLRDVIPVILFVFSILTTAVVAFGADLALLKFSRPSNIQYCLMEGLVFVRSPRLLGLLPFGRQAVHAVWGLRGLPLSCPGGHVCRFGIGGHGQNATTPSRVEGASLQKCLLRSVRSSIGTGVGPRWLDRESVLQLNVFGFST